MHATARYRYQAIAIQIAAQIDAGFYAEGDKLPSVRSLMRAHSISLTTASRVMIKLESMGYAQSRDRSGFYVQNREQAVPPETAPHATSTAEAPASVNISHLISKIFRSSASQPVLPLGAAELADELLPHKDLAAALNKALRGAGARAFAYGPAGGEPQLRRRIATLMGNRGVAVAPDEIILTVGESDAMGAALRALTRPGDAVAVESPTFFGLLQWIEALGLKAIEIATCPREGMDVDELRRVLAATSVAAIVVNPTFHNPFGSAMSPERMRALVDTAFRADVPVIEDDVYGDLHFGPNARRPLKSFDRTGAVLYCSSFSKTLAPGFRVGWCIPGRYRDTLQTVRPNNYGNCPPVQLALAEYLRGRKYGEHVERLRVLFASQRDVIRKTVLESFPAGTRVSAPEGGYVYWIELPPGGDSLALYREALAQGTLIAPGPIFSPTGRFANAFRLSFGCRLTPALLAGIRRLGAHGGAK